MVTDHSTGSCVDSRTYASKGLVSLVKLCTKSIHGEWEVNETSGCGRMGYKAWSTLLKHTVIDHCEAQNAPQVRLVEITTRGEIRE